eukprot:1159287-Pelagomonas_calceolata.AAC.6
MVCGAGAPASGGMGTNGSVGALLTSLYKPGAGTDWAGPLSPNHRAALARVLLSEREGERKGHQL